MLPFFGKFMTSTFVWCCLFCDTVWFSQFSLHSDRISCNISVLTFLRDVGLGDVVTVGQCRPLSKTVRFNVLKVTKGKGSKDKKQFEKF